MYALLLAFRYLRTRLIPLVAIAAVGLCVALVVVVVSIMSGFLYQMEKAGKTLIGDVVVSNGLRGLPDPEGSLPIWNNTRALRPPRHWWTPSPPSECRTTRSEGYKCGIEPDSFDQVTGFAKTLH